MSHAIKKSFIPTAWGNIAITEQGDVAAPAVLLSHSILASSMMWEEQLALLADSGWRAIAVDTRGHGASSASIPPYTLDELGLDIISVLDSLSIDKAHFVGLSLGGMIGFGLGIHHGSRLLSLCICDARADAPPPVFNQWSERMGVAKQQGCVALAIPTTERWFGKAFLETNPKIASRFQKTISKTSLDGYVGCAQAIQQMHYLEQLHNIQTRTTLIVGGNDTPLPETMKEIQSRIRGASLEFIPNAGHLPNIDQADLFNTALLRHLETKSFS
jgi:3-oxoadipate enol-lactonase